MRFSKQRVFRLLDILDANDLEPVYTFIIPSGYWEKFIEESDPIAKGFLNEIENSAGKKITLSPTGIIAFWGKLTKILLIPPFPIKKANRKQFIYTASMRENLEQKYLIGVILIRLGKYAVGIFHGDQILDSKSGSRYVKGRHKAGGTSQQRFARIRNKQIQELFNKVCSITTEKMNPYKKQMDYVFMGGEKHTILNFSKTCPFIQSMGAKIVDRNISTREPSLRELLSMPSKLWNTEVKLVEWPDSIPTP